MGGHIQATGFYMVQQWFAVENLVANAISDVRIDLAWDIIMANMTGLIIEYSTDGIAYSYLDFVGGDEVTYQATGLTASTHYWFRIQGVKAGTYSEYCTPDDDWAAMKFIVESTGDGTARGNCRFTVISSVQATIDGNGLFWTASTGGTSSTTWNLTVGTSTRYISVSSGMATVLVFHKNYLINWGEAYIGGSGSLGWVAQSSNQPKITITTLSLARSLEHICLGFYGPAGGVMTGTWAELPPGLLSFYINRGTSNITGAPSDLPRTLKVFSFISGGALVGDCNGLPSGIQSLYLGSSLSNLSGNVSDLPNTLQYLNLTAGTTITGDVANVPQNGILTYLYLGGSNTVSGDIAGIDYSDCALTLLYLEGFNTVSGDIADLPNTLTSVSLGGSNTVSGDIGDVPQNGILLYLALTGYNTVSGDIGGLDYSGCALKSLYLTGNNTIDGDVSGIPDTVTYTYIYGFNAISGDIGGIVQTDTVQIYGNNVIEGDVADIPNNTFTTITIIGANTITGDIANLPNQKTTSVQILGNATLSGNIENLPVNITSFYAATGNTIGGDINNLPSDTALASIILSGSNTVTGDIANFPNTLTRLEISGANTLYGDLADLTTSVTYFILTGANTVSDYNPPSGGKTWMNLAVYGTHINFRPAAGSGLSSAEVDELIIDLDDSTIGYFVRTIYITGGNAARTAASDAAVASLLSKGITVTTNP
jgi:hypothetical protein